MKVPNSRFGNKGGCGLVANSMCVQVYVLYETNESRHIMSRNVPGLKFPQVNKSNASVDDSLKRTVRRMKVRRSRNIRAIVRYDELQSEQVSICNVPVHNSPPNSKTGRYQYIIGLRDFYKNVISA